MGNEKYTQKVIEAFQSAQQIAALHYNQELSSVHMLMGLTKEPEGLLIRFSRNVTLTSPCSRPAWNSC